MFSKLSTRGDIADIRARLTAADPAGGPLEASTTARLAALWHRIEFDGPLAAPRTRRAWWPDRAGRQPRRKIVIACVAVPALAAATAAGWVAADTPGSYVATNIWCFSSTSPDGNSAELPASGQNPVAACAQIWAQGDLDPGVHRAPPLVACSLGSFDGGSIGVYPDTTCQAEHLPPVPAGYQQASQNMAALTKTLEADGLYSDGLTAHPVIRCYSAAAGAALAKQALQSNGFTGWRVVVRPGGRCVQAIPDSASHTVLILGS
jgi:hypothetical protein